MEFQIIDKLKAMNYKVNSEFRFTTKLSEERTISLIVYIDYEKKSYDFMQGGEEGVFPIKHNRDTEINIAYFKLGLEVLDFINSELYK